MFKLLFTVLSYFICESITELHSSIVIFFNQSANRLDGNCGNACPVPYFLNFTSNCWDKVINKTLLFETPLAIASSFSARTLLQQESLVGRTLLATVVESIWATKNYIRFCSCPPRCSCHFARTNLFSMY